MFPVEKHYTEVGHIINAFFREFVEETLIQPTFVYGHPVAIMSPLAKKNPEDHASLVLFQALHHDKEYGNAFTELNDPIDRLSRFEAQAAAKNSVMTKQQVSTTTTLTLEYGMPPTGGLGISIDRLCMLLTDTTTIRDVLLFPTMK